MAGLSQKIVNGNLKALSLAKTLLTKPMLINIDPRQGAIYSLTLDAETNQKSATAEVSESLVIATDSKKWISDNIAPGAKSWRLSGYIKGIPLLEPTNYFQPFVKMHTEILWSWFTHGAVLIYKDGDANIYTRVVIKDLQTSQQKDSANACPFNLTLKEINTLDMSMADVSTTDSIDIGKYIKSMPAVGSAIGTAVSLGVTAAETTNAVNETVDELVS
jgi:hypothetical protein